MTKETKKAGGPDPEEWAKAKAERDEALDAAKLEDGSIDVELVAEIRDAWEERKAELLGK